MNKMTAGRIPHEQNTTNLYLESTSTNICFFIILIPLITNQLCMHFCLSADSNLT